MKKTGIFLAIIIVFIVSLNSYGEAQTNLNRISLLKKLVTLNNQNIDSFFDELKLDLERNLIRFDDRIFKIIKNKVRYLIVDEKIDKKGGYILKLKELKRKYEPLNIEGNWQNKSVYGSSVLTIKSEEFKQENSGTYHYKTGGEIVKFDNKQRYFIVHVKYHSEKWGSYQINKYGRHAYDFIDKTHIKYSGAMNFYNSIDEAIEDTDVSNGAADTDSGSYDIYELINK